MNTPVFTPQQIDYIRSLIADTINNNSCTLYDCTRVWEAWSVGTMSQDDFVSLDQTEFSSEIADIVASHMPTSKWTDQFVAEAIYKSGEISSYIG